MIGFQLGHDRIERLLGACGMGEVYLASDTKLGRQVALKVLSERLAGDPDRLERFQREARAAAALNHPNIVHDPFGREDRPGPVLTLELVDGQTLSELIPPGGQPLDRVPLMYIDTRGGVSNLMRQPLSSSAPEAVTKCSAEQLFNYPLAPDQKPLARPRARQLGRRARAGAGEMGALLASV